MNGLCGIATDVSEYEALKSQVNKLAKFDALTNLGNRQTLIEHLSDRYSKHSSKSTDWLMFIDIDEFKTFNDRYGHDIGDQLLKQVGERIRSHCRAGEFVGRLGADEFYCLSQTLGHQSRLSGFDEWLNQLEVKLGAPFVVDDTQLFVSFSFGVVRLADCKDYIEGHEGR